MSHNDITGDKIATDVPSEAFRTGYDLIDWSKKPVTIGEMVEQEKERNDAISDLAGN
jgi:hypothetical protein